MAMHDRIAEPPAWRLVAERIAAARAALVSSALVLAVLTLTAPVSPLQAVIGWGVILLAVLLRSPTQPGPGVADAAAVMSGLAPAVAVPDTRARDAVVAAVPDPVILVDADTRVLTFNGAARALAPALAQGQALALALRVPEIVEAVRTTGPDRQAQHVEFSERVPIDRWYAVHVRHLDLAGQAGRLLVFHDLTPLRRSEEMRADFVANASHELRTPLAALSGFIDTLQGPARDDAAARARFLAIMKEQAARMARLIDDLLSLSRVELNEHLHPETPLDLIAVVRQVADGLQMLAHEREVDVVIRAPAGPLMVAGDRDELVRVYENLIENALKYGASGKKVEVTLQRGGNGSPEAVVMVRDFGPGIPAEHLPRLTERFYRVDVGQSRAEGGTGLGLALVKHILNRHRGRLTIDSTVGQGARFITALPLTGPDSPGAEN